MTRERIDVLADRQADTLEAWLRAHPGVQVVCRDGSGAYAEAIRRALPEAVQVVDRWKQVHALLNQGVGLLECARRLGLALNTVKRYARVSEPERLVHVPKYRPTLVDPFRDHLRRRWVEDPAVPVQQLLAEIKKAGRDTSVQPLTLRTIMVRL